MLRIYRAPDGRTYQYEEGTQPEGYELDAPKPDTAKPKPAPKRRTTAANKRRTAQDKTKEG